MRETASLFSTEHMMGMSPEESSSMHQLSNAPALERDCDAILPSVTGTGPTGPTTEGPRGINRPTIVQLVIVAIISILVWLGMAAYGKKTHAWIVLDFKTTRGHVTQMAFSNPDTLNENECRESLPKALEFLIRTAIQQTPSLRSATVIGARCMMSVHDPIKRSNRPKS
ncbi:MAG: hypothetical protein ABW047_10595 [Nitrospiraceae bacterium]